MRNNCGSYKSPTGTFVRYGVGNPGGSDLIGLRCITVTPEMVGQQIGQFLAVEVKRPGGHPTDEQVQFIEMVRNMGGLGFVATSDEHARALLDAEPHADPRPLSELGLETRIYHALRRAGLQWIHEVQCLITQDLVNIPSIGASSAAKIQAAVEEWRAG